VHRADSWTYRYLACPATIFPSGLAVTQLVTFEVTAKEGCEDMRLEHLCDMDLGYTTEFFLVQPYGGEEGTAYGEGNGTVTGEELSGHARWSNHPHRRSDGSMLPKTRGVIETPDGAQVILT
jgi:hypothetical protein